MKEAQKFNRAHSISVNMLLSSLNDVRVHYELVWLQTKIMSEHLRNSQLVSVHTTT